MRLCSCFHGDMAWSGLDNHKGSAEEDPDGLLSLIMETMRTEGTPYRAPYSGKSLRCIGTCQEDLSLMLHQPSL